MHRNLLSCFCARKVPSVLFSSRDSPSLHVAFSAGKFSRLEKILLAGEGLKTRKSHGLTTFNLRSKRYLHCIKDAEYLDTLKIIKKVRENLCSPWQNEWLIKMAWDCRLHPQSLCTSANRPLILLQRIYGILLQLYEI